MILRRVSEKFIGELLKRRFPGVVIDPASFAPLLSDLEVITFRSKGRKLGLACGALAASIIGIQAVAEFRLTTAPFAQLERKVVTLFILGSNFLDVKNPRAERVTYKEVDGMPPNRFSEYDF